MTAPPPPMLEVTGRDRLYGRFMTVDRFLVLAVEKKHWILA